MAPHGGTTTRDCLHAIPASNGWSTPQVLIWAHTRGREDSSDGQLWLEDLPSTWLKLSLECAAIQTLLRDPSSFLPHIFDHAGLKFPLPAFSCSLLCPSQAFAQTCTWGPLLSRCNFTSLFILISLLFPSTSHPFLFLNLPFVLLWFFAVYPHLTVCGIPVSRDTGNQTGMEHGWMTEHRVDSFTFSSPINEHVFN